MPRKTSIVPHEDKIVASSSSSDTDDHDSLGTDQEQAPKGHPSTYDARSSSAMLQCWGGSHHNGIHLPASKRSSWRTTFQCKFESLSQQHD